MDGHFSDLLCLLKNRQKSDSFAAYSEQQFNATMSRTDLYKYTMFNVVMQINLIDTIRTFMKPNCN